MQESFMRFIQTPNRENFLAVREWTVESEESPLAAPHARATPMADVAEIVVKFIKFAVLLFLLLLIPATLIVATPFVLLWPRQKEGQASYGRTVLRRYGKVARAASFVTLFGGAAIDE